MATFNPLHPLQSTILEVLTEQQGISVADLHAKLKKDYGLKLSVQNLYKTIGKMLDAQMLIKTQGKLLLNLVWLSHLTHFVEAAKRTYLTAEEATINLPLKDDERREFYAESLIGLDPIWNHLLIKLKDFTEDRTWYVYDSHPWYVLGMRETETRLYKSLVSEGINVQMLYGNDTFLDKYGNKRVSVKGFRSAITTDSPFLKEGYALWVCGEHIVECIFPDVISRNFQFFFQTVQSVEEFEPELFSDIFKMRSKCKITIRRSAKESKALIKHWMKHF
ncbi:hypothetical protein HZA87_02820 [Candidatus Uhrbacteria bacterium]|nr:hypothetical protein [Candidatus Uhrbacteria bacterium]